MNKDIQEISNDMGALADSARDLMTATADMAGDKAGETRKRLARALESSKKLYDRVHDRAVAGVRSAGRAVHEHPYPVIGLALGLGAVIGYLLTRRNGR